MTHEPCDKVKDLDRKFEEAVHGNGKPGIKTELALLQAEVATLRKAVVGCACAAGASAATSIPDMVGIFKAVLANI